MENPWTPNRQVADFQSEVPILKAIWFFDHVINVESRDNLKSLYFCYHKIYDQ